MASELVSTKVNQAQNPLTSSKIQYLISNAIATYSSYAGWDIRYFPKINMLLVNVPSIVSGGTTQFAANQLTNAWTTFNGMDASSWGTYSLNPMFGTYDGRVMSAWTGSLDSVTMAGSGGTAIQSEVQQAYTYFGHASTQKQVGMYQPVMVGNYAVAVSTEIEYDFASTTLDAPTAINPNSGSTLWNYSLWNTASWVGGSSVQKPWFGAEGMGIAASLKMMTQSSGDVLWVATNYNLVNGKGVL
jgi:hypothetical protein